MPSVWFVRSSWLRPYWAGHRVLTDISVPEILATAVVGSYPQPDWLIDRARLSTGVPRVRMHELWRIGEPHLEQAQDDATRLAIQDMERAGIDIISDGEIRRESYSNRFATALAGLDLERPAVIRSRGGTEVQVPRIVGPLVREAAVEVRDMTFLRRHTDRCTKITLPGPFTLAQQAQDEYYHDDEAVAMAYAEAVNAEARALEAAGADVIQLDEPWLRNDPRAAGRYAVKAINRALEGLRVTTGLHLCFGYAAVIQGTKPAGYSFLGELADTVADQISIESAQPKIDLSVLRDLPHKVIVLGVLDLSDSRVETPQAVAARIRHGLEHVGPQRLIPAPDCGMKYLSREVAYGKLAALSAGAAIVRRELNGR